MKRLSLPMVAKGLLAVIAIGACRTTPREVERERGVQPAIQHGATGLSAPQPKTDTVRRSYVLGDVRFMQGMIAHHAQALKMTSLVPTRTARDDMRLLARRIEVSQQDEIALMRHWLGSRREGVPSLDALHEHHDPAGHYARMPGMLTREELAQLAKATGGEFDRLFLQLMMRHHEGALTMVADLFATNGAGQEPEAFRFASDVDADQRAEIKRMQAVLESMPARGSRP